MRTDKAIVARESLGDDFFGGWEPSDKNILMRYKYDAEGEPSYITDFLGVKTSTALVPWASHLTGLVVTDIPIPDDGVRAEAIEYIALLNSIESASTKQYAMVELGASYAPWTCAAGVLAMRKGVARISLRSVEASSFFQPLIKANFEKNGLMAPPAGVSIDVRIFAGAVSTKKDEMFFPLVTSASENGGAASEENVEVDYVGRKITNEKVTTYTLDEILEGIATLDFLHCDIQGTEREVLLGGAALLSQRVKSIFIGTHSRSIEGALFECFHAYGWNLVRERPTKFVHRPELNSPVGMTTRDGGQFWVNRRFI